MMSKAKGLDLGTSRIVLAAPNEDESVAYTAQLNAFVALPYSKVTERALLKQGIPHAVEGKEIIAYGDRAAEFANLLQGDTRRPMQTGLLNPHEPKSLQMIELALERIVGRAAKGDKICFSTPAAPPTNENDLIYHERTVRQMLEKLGYQVKSLNEGLAVVYAELEEDNFTGIGVSFGGGMCNVCVAYLGMPAISFSTVRAGDYIDRSASSVSGETPATVRLHKESGFSLNGLSANSIDQALSVYYNDVIETVTDGLAQALAGRGKLPKLDRPAPVVLAGGTTLAGSFRGELEKAVRKRQYPIEIGEIRMAADPLHTTAKGALMAAMLEM
jgi:hypothetical protein